MVLDQRFSGPGRFYAHDRFDLRRRFGRVAVAPAAVVSRKCPFGLRLGAHGAKLLRRVEGQISLAGGDERASHFGMPVAPGELGDRLAFPVEPEPG
jgi:hypothetical protein